MVSQRTSYSREIREDRGSKRVTRVEIARHLLFDPLYFNSASGRQCEVLSPECAKCADEICCVSVEKDYDGADVVYRI